MMQITKIIAVMLSFFFLAGCKQSTSYQYLIEHPDILQKELAECEASANDSCETIRRAAEDFMGFVNSRQQNPELFGKQIIEAQQQLVKAKEDWQRAKNELALHPDNLAAQKNAAFAEESYKNLHQKVKTLLAVVAATSSEG